jgi:hypothetical protein
LAFGVEAILNHASIVLDPLPEIIDDQAVFFSSSSEPSNSIALFICPVTRSPEVIEPAEVM